MLQIIQYLLIFILFQFCHGKIGDLTVKKIDPLILNNWQQRQCKELRPCAARCDNAYKKVEVYCHNYAQKIDKNCDALYADLKVKCNNAEIKIKEKCKAANGYVTGSCGQKFDRLQKVCIIKSDTISRSCTKRYKKMNKKCLRKYGKTDLKCNRIYEEYEDMCEGELQENIWNNKKIKNEVKLKEVDEVVEEIKSMMKSNFYDKSYLNPEKKLKEINVRNKNDQIFKKYAVKYENLQNINGKSVFRTKSLTKANDINQNKKKSPGRAIYEEFEKLLKSNERSSPLNQAIQEPYAKSASVSKSEKPTEKTLYENFEELLELNQEASPTKQVKKTLRNQETVEKSKKATGKLSHEEFEEWLESDKRNTVVKSAFKKTPTNKDFNEEFEELESDKREETVKLANKASMKSRQKKILKENSFHDDFEENDTNKKSSKLNLTTKSSAKPILPKKSKKSFFDTYGKYLEARKRAIAQMKGTTKASITVVKNAKKVKRNFINDDSERLIEHNVRAAPPNQVTLATPKQVPPPKIKKLVSKSYLEDWLTAFNLKKKSTV